jgi:cupin fold WbuC family metalloprotein
MKIFTFHYIESLIKSAEQSHRLRAHSNIHESYQDSIQKIFIAIKANSYIRPHRHTLDPKEECLIAIKGLLSLVLFSDKGEIASITVFGSEKYVEKMPIASGVQISANAWHSVVSLSDDSILFEVKDGPFNAAKAKELSNWSPGEGDADSINYLQSLRELSLKYMKEYF